jgi:hypothetical protein
MMWNLASGYAALAQYGPLVAEDTRALVESSKASLISGELQVFRRPIVDNTGKVQVADGQIANFEELLNLFRRRLDGRSDGVR